MGPSHIALFFIMVFFFFGGGVFVCERTRDIGTTDSWCASHARSRSHCRPTCYSCVFCVCVCFFSNSDHLVFIPFFQKVFTFVCFSLFSFAAVTADFIAVVGTVVGAVVVLVVPAAAAIVVDVVIVFYGCSSV